MNAKVKRLKEIAAELREMFAGQPEFHLSVQIDTGYTTAGFHHQPNYDAGTSLLRSLGIGERNKTIVEGDNPFCALHGVSEGDTGSGRITFTAYCAGLPATCKIVTEMVSIPKTSTVDTGETILVPQTRVVCGEESK